LANINRKLKFASCKLNPQRASSLSSHKAQTRIVTTSLLN